MLRLLVACTGSQGLLSLIALVHLQIGPARQTRSYPEPSGPREHGFVERFKEHYGFIRWTLATCGRVLAAGAPAHHSHVWHVALMAGLRSAPHIYRHSSERIA